LKNIVKFLQKLGQILKSLSVQDSWKYTFLWTEGVQDLLPSEYLADALEG
jgi:hypothetical protein